MLDFIQAMEYQFKFVQTNDATIDNDCQLFSVTGNNSFTAWNIIIHAWHHRFNLKNPSAF